MGETSYPPALLPTRQMAAFFDMTCREPAWHRKRPAHAASPAVALPMMVPASSLGTRGGAPSSAPPTAAGTSSVTGRTTPLTLEQTKRIEQWVQENAPAKKGGFGFNSMVSSLSRYVASVEPKDVTRDWLLKMGVNLETLVFKLEIPITDLYSAHIVRKPPDLIALGFALTDITRNRKLFRADQAIQFFGLHNAALEGMGIEAVSLAMLARADPPFSAEDLHTLGVEAETLLAGIGPGQIALLSLLKPAVWADLGLTETHLKNLAVTSDVAWRKLKWDKAETRRLWDI